MSWSRSAQPCLLGGPDRAGRQPAAAGWGPAAVGREGPAAGPVLLATTQWPGADVELEVLAGAGSWRGIAEDGHGRLRSRRVQVW